MVVPRVAAEDSPALLAHYSDEDDLDLAIAASLRKRQTTSKKQKKTPTTTKATPKAMTHKKTKKPDQQKEVKEGPKPSAGVEREEDDAKWFRHYAEACRGMPRVVRLSGLTPEFRQRIALWCTRRRNASAVRATSGMRECVCVCG